MSFRKARFFQLPFIKRPLLGLYNSYWCLVQNAIKDDRLFISYKYWTVFHKRLNWDNPQTFNEKLQWLKLYAHRPSYVTMADKYAVKQYVADRIGEEYVVPLYGVWEDANDINFDDLPDQFALKCNHNSGQGRCICSDKTKLDYSKVREELRKGLKSDYYLPGRDKQYRDIPKRIIAEKYLDDHTGSELRDYKFWCFNGNPVYMYCTNKGDNIYENFYDMEFNPVPINHGFPRLLPELEKPLEFDLMKDLAKVLSKGIPFVRVDFFDIDNHVYFSEFTFFDWGGFRPFLDGWDEKLGELITLPN